MRTPTLTNEMRSLLIDCAREGLKLPLCAQRAGVETKILRRWLASKQYEQFAIEFNEAAAEYKAGLIRNANVQAINGHWGALQYLLDASGLGGDFEEALNNYKESVMEALVGILEDQPDKLREIAQEFQKRGL